MLFCSIVFMSRTFRGQWTSVVLVFILKLSVASRPQRQIKNENATNFDNDFGNFLRELGTNVYKAKKIGVTQNEIRPCHTTTPPIIKNYRRNMMTFNPQKAILQDVLMMKLVSYYEDKYKLSRLKPTTTASITLSNNVNSNVLTKQNKLQYNFIEKDQALRSNAIPKPAQKIYTRLNRRMDPDRIRIEEYQVPEVIIL